MLFNNSDPSGMTVGNPLTEVFYDLCKFKYLNFTHLAAHGEDDDGDMSHG